MQSGSLRRKETKRKPWSSWCLGVTAGGATCRRRVASNNRNLEQFVRISSHDLRQTMNMIVQVCGLIESGSAYQLDDKGRLYFGQVRLGAARMKTMLDDVLQFVRIDETQGLALEVADLDRIVADVLEGLTASISSRAKPRLPPAPSDCCADTPPCWRCFCRT